MKSLHVNPTAVTVPCFHARLAMFALSIVACTTWSSCTPTATKPVMRRERIDAAEVTSKAHANAAEMARLKRALRTRVSAFCATNGCPGATVGFVLRDGRCGRTAVGVSRRGDDRAMQPDDRMFSGSIGKTYVAALMLELAAERDVNLNTRIAAWFGNEPWFSRLPNAPDITLRMLLNHSSGIPRHLFVPAFQERVKAEPQRVWRPEELIAYVLDAEPIFPAGTGWSYADTNYILVGMIIERITGRTYYEVLTDRVLVPLHLNETSPADRPELDGLVSGYTSEDNFLDLPTEVVVEGRYAMNPQLEWTGGGLVSTASDLARWAWLLYGGRVLADESLQTMLHGVPTGRTAQEQYGLGVFSRPSRHGMVQGHTGWVPGYVSIMAYYPKHGVAIAVQTNSDVGMRGALLEELLDQLADELIQV